MIRSRTTSDSRWLRLLLPGCAAAVLASSLGACAPKSQARLALEDACRSQANRIYDEQHRDLMSRDDQSTSPASSTGLMQFPGGALGDTYAHDQRVDDCISRRTSSTRDGLSFGPSGAH